MDGHYLDIKETIQLPSERCIYKNPSISAIAALDATLAIAKKAILCDNPSIRELMDSVDEEEEVPLHLFSAHNIIDTIDRLRLNIHVYNEQTEEFFQNIRTQNLPF